MNIRINVPIVVAIAAVAVGLPAAEVLAEGLPATTNAAAPSPYWPGWLGPDRNGWVAGFKSPARWPA
ncbi:MAG: hypothetical protein VX877_04835, partial [Planctomycetota bacterium]|nr:hypothetical protein [Planctomycetota bacterium]